MSEEAGSGSGAEVAVAGLQLAEDAETESKNCRAEKAGHDRDAERRRADVPDELCPEPAAKQSSQDGPQPAPGQLAWHDRVGQRADHAGHQEVQSKREQGGG